MSKPIIQIKDFYGIASILMIIVILANLWNLYVNWNIMNLAGKISFIAGSILFQLLLFALFFGLWKTTPKIGTIVEDEVLDDILNKIETKNEKIEKVPEYEEIKKSLNRLRKLR